MIFCGEYLKLNTAHPLVEKVKNHPCVLHFCNRSSPSMNLPIDNRVVC